MISGLTDREKIQALIHSAKLDQQKIEALRKDNARQFSALYRIYLLVRFRRSKYAEEIAEIIKNLPGVIREDL